MGKSPVEKVGSVEALRDTSFAQRNSVYVPGKRGGTFDYTETDPYGNGDDNGIVFQNKRGGYWVRRFDGPPHAIWWGKDESAIEKAITTIATQSSNRSGVENYTTLYIDEALIPYDATKVTFDTDVRLCRPESPGEDVYDVLAYGADPNNNQSSASRNVAAFNAALDVGNVNYRRVYVPRGRYYVDSPIIVASNQELIGTRENEQFKGTEILLADGSGLTANEGVIQTRTVNSGGVWSFGKIKNIVIKANYQNNANGNGLRVDTYGQQSEIEHVYVWDAPDNGFYFTGAPLQGHLNRCFAHTCQTYAFHLENTSSQAKRNKSKL